MKNPISNEPYRNPDLGLAAFLATQPDIQFLGLEPKDLNSFYFTFSPYESLFLPGEMGEPIAPFYRARISLCASEQRDKNDQQRAHHYQH
jgi:hypothetical protein